MTYCDVNAASLIQLIQKERTKFKNKWQSQLEKHY